MHTPIPFFQTQPYNVMRTAVAILRHKRADWRHRLFTFRDMQRAALRQAWADHQMRQRETARRFQRYGHLLGLDRAALLARREELRRDLRELEYCASLPRDRYDRTAAEIEVIDWQILPHI